MIGEGLIQKKPVNLAEVKAILSTRKKDAELNYEQDIALKYARKFAKTSPKDTEKLSKELSKIESLTPELATKIIDLLPIKKETLELIIQRDAQVSQEDFAKVLELTTKYRKK
ncbi:MAG: hypothetical protein CL943_02240 [Candidatus Diapherotrites archaeon]|uniref:DNA-directed RNA polymerase subunit Rpo4 n=1 Tax=Candidatus Iainarchaeum sp. TaxID=3101447 RepID=A0A2D6M112_9ARCH|nr:hypothetical protein [Candidatus Diapherotrites archaeon]|tara:strand:- start:2946 stop:3284 length:339 start_codon:yes stop_codon:yes gene_type:complete